MKKNFNFQKLINKKGYLNPLLANYLQNIIYNILHLIYQITTYSRLASQVD